MEARLHLGLQVQARDGLSDPVGDQAPVAGSTVQTARIEPLSFTQLENGVICACAENGMNTKKSRARIYFMVSSPIKQLKVVYSDRLPGSKSWEPKKAAGLARCR